MASEIFDDFNRADSLSLGTSSSGHTWISTRSGDSSGTDDCGITSNQAYGVNANNGNSVIETGTPNVYMKLTTTHADPGGFMLRHDLADPGSDRGIYLRSSGPDWDLVSWDGTTETSLGSGGTTDSGDVIEIYAIGNDFTVYLNGNSTPIITGSSSLHHDNTMHGLSLWNFGSTRTVDDFEMARIGISFVGSSEGVSGTNATSYSIAPIPTGVEVGNVCFLVVSCPTSTTGDPTMSGWTLVRTLENTNAHRVSVWYRVMQAGDDSADTFTFDQPGTAEGIAWVSAAYRGVDTTNPLIDEDGAFSANDADFSLAAPSITNDDAWAWHIAAVGASDLEANDTTITFSASGTHALTECNEIDGSATSEVTGAAWYDSRANVSTGTKDVTGAIGSTAVAMDMGVWHGLLRPQRISANAETVTATVTANDATVTTTTPNVSANAETVTASVTANNASVSVKPNAGTVTASASVDNAAASIKPSAGTVTATASVSDGTRHIDAGTVTGSATANDASVTVKANAGTVTATASVDSASAAVKPSAGTVTATASVGDGARQISAETVTAAATANDASVAVRANAGTVTASAAVDNATGSLGAAAGTVTASASVDDPTAAVKVSAGTVTATASVDDATVTVFDNVSGEAEDASGTAAAYDASVQLKANAGTVTVTATVDDVPAAVGGLAGTVTASASVDNATGAVGASAEDVTASAQAFNSSQSGEATGLAGTVTGSATAYDASVTVKANAETVSATVSVSSPTGLLGALAGHVTASATANDATVRLAALAQTVTAVVEALSASLGSTANAESVASTVSAFNAMVAVGTLAEHVTATAEASDATTEQFEAEGAPAGRVTVTAAAYDAAVAIGAPAGTVTVTVTADDATPGAGGAVTETHPIQVLVGTKPQSKRGVNIKRLRPWRE